MKFRNDNYLVINIPSEKFETPIRPAVDGEIKILESTLKKKVERYVLRKVRIWLNTYLGRKSEVFILQR
jgi:hypothetical protein